MAELLITSYLRLSKIMIVHSWLLAISGLCAGLLAGLLGIGGGILLVPILYALQFSPVQAFATSSLAIFITAFAGSLQNWRMGYLDFRRILALGVPSIATAPIGANLANRMAPQLILYLFSGVLVANLFLSNWRRQLANQPKDDLNTNQSQTFSRLMIRLGTGGAAGLLAGLFGLGGGVILVPFQMVFLKETIKTAIQTSLGVIVITAISACASHALQGNVIFAAGLILGTFGLIGAQVSTRFLPKLPDKVIQFSFNVLLVSLMVYIVSQASRL